MTIRVIDIETTGTDPEKDRVCEIASVDLAAGGGYANAISGLCNPGIPMPAQASATHHLIDSDLAGQPSYQDLIGRFRGADYYAAHNAKFEQSFIGGDIDGRWICTYKCALRLWPLLPQHTNQTLRYFLGLVDPCGVPRSEIHPHRALSDVIVTAAILHKMLADASWGQLVSWSSEPALFTVFGFGKHKGQRFDAAPIDYLQWITRQTDMDEGIVHSARYWLAQRAAA